MKPVSAFSSVDALTVLAVLGMLGLLAYPSISRARLGSEAAGCQHHGRQLMLAMHLYAADHNELLPPNEDNNNQFNGWVGKGINRSTQPNNPDILWMQERTSAPR